MTTSERLTIGIPNRSSLLHVGAVTQCIAAGLIDKSDYHPAKLHYDIKVDLQEGTLLLTSNQNLCDLLSKRDLDLIFTGDDYVREYTDEKPQKIPFSFIESRMALISRGVNLPESIEAVFTKYPKTAAIYLQEWGIIPDRIEQIAGGSESYCFISDSYTTFDVVSTGVTATKNNLQIHRETPTHSCSWYYYDGEVPNSLKLVLDDKLLLSNLKQMYLRLLQLRDMNPLTAVTATLENYFIELSNIGGNTDDFRTRQAILK